jgi:hypothetical protein
MGHYTSLRIFEAIKVLCFCAFVSCRHTSISRCPELFQSDRTLKGILLATSGRHFYSCLSSCDIDQHRGFALIRWSVRLASCLSNSPALIAVMLANVVFGAALAGPLVYVVLYSVPVLGPSLRALVAISLTSLFTALAAFAVVLVLLGALVHRLVWPVISRPLYAAHRYGLISQHKFVTALGASCLLMAWPNNVLAKAIAKAIHLG